MIDHQKLRQWLRLDRGALAAGLALAATFVPFTATAATSVALKVEVADTLPGFHLANLSRYLALHMTTARLADWRFEPAVDKGSSPDRVEWIFKLNPYAGGEVRRFMPLPMAERILGVHRPITIEARLYLNGEYQALVERQLVIQGGPSDPDLADAVASLTQNLLRPAGAYRAVDTGVNLRRRAACGGCGPSSLIPWPSLGCRRHGAYSAVSPTLMPPSCQSAPRRPGA